MILREQIMAGQTHCVNTGMVTLIRQPNGTLFFSYSGNEAGGRIYTDVGPLTRVRPA